jgi:hypothetical protein
MTPAYPDNPCGKCRPPPPSAAAADPASAPATAAVAAAAGGDDNDWGPSCWVAEASGKSLSGSGAGGGLSATSCASMNG